MASGSLHTYRPSVYFDLWVWIDLAKAANGRPTSQANAEMLAAFIRAGDAGVAFPLSAAHYVEITEKIKNPRQRQQVAEVMATVSHCRTLASRRTLLRQQLLLAMHEHLGRPRFRPEARDALAVGVHWAFTEHVQMLRLAGPDGMAESVKAFLKTDQLRRMNQWTELSILAGPRDEDVERLRSHYGYRPEATVGSSASRLEFEQIYERILDDDPISRAELRFRVQLRELIHEHAELFGAVLRDHGMSLDHLIFRGTTVLARRTALAEFLDSMPSVRVAVDLKTGFFRDNRRPLDVNDLHDVDAMSFAVPYCHVAVPDKAVEDSLQRVDASGRFGTVITRRLEDVVELLPMLESKAMRLSDPSGWDQLGPGHGFHPISPADVFATAL